jgi:ATP dependent DNA ligase domain
MLAMLTLKIPPRQEDYSFEYKWDGVRAILRWDGRHLTVQSRNQLDITPRYPELWPLANLFGSRQVMLDGLMANRSSIFPGSSVAIASKSWNSTAPPGCAPPPISAKVSICWPPPRR